MGRRRSRKPTRRERRALRRINDSVARVRGLDLGLRSITVEQTAHAIAVGLHTVERACDGKVWYYNERSAEHNRPAAERNAGKALYNYRCMFCGKWHHAKTRDSARVEMARVRDESIAAANHQFSTRLSTVGVEK